MMKVSEVIEGAIAAIEKYGWTQGRLGRDHIGFCGRGAIYRAADFWGDGMPYDAWDAWGHALVIRTEGVVEQAGGPAVRLVGLPTWNDQPGRTKEEVLDLLRKGLARAKEMESLEAAQAALNKIMEGSCAKSNSEAPTPTPSTPVSVT